MYIFKHCRDVGCSYIKHFNVSINLAKKFGSASFKALVHAFLPFMFVTGSTDAINDLNECMKNSPCKKNDH
jgi:hypothetical protein